MSMDRSKTIRVSEQFFRVAAAPTAVVLRRGAKASPFMEKVGRIYYVTYHFCEEPLERVSHILEMSQWAYNKKYMHRHCGEGGTAYDLTWDEAIQLYYERCLDCSRGTDIEYPETATLSRGQINSFPVYHRGNRTRSSGN